MSDREEEMGRLAAREQQEQEQDTAEDIDTKQEGTAGASEAADDTQTPSDSDTTENASERAAVNVKDRGSNLFMYLPQSLSNEVDLACQSVNLTYQRESGEKLGKNRYLYPIVLMVGIDAAVDLSYEEIRDLVERIDAMEGSGCNDDHSHRTNRSGLCLMNLHLSNTKSRPVTVGQRV